MAEVEAVVKDLVGDLVGDMVGAKVETQANIYFQSIGPLGRCFL